VKILSLHDLPKVNETPLARVIHLDTMLIVEFDDNNENRVTLQFSPIQAFRWTTIDCYEVLDNLLLISRNILELLNSEWVRQLTETLSSVDHSARFMENVRHFLIPLGDGVLEVVASDVGKAPDINF